MPSRLLLFSPLVLHALLEGPGSVAMLIAPAWLFPDVAVSDLNLVRGLGGALLALSVLAVLALSHRVTLQLIVATLPLAIFHLTSLALVIYRWTSNPDVPDRMITSILIHSILGLWFAFLVVAYPTRQIEPKHHVSSAALGP